MFQPELHEPQLEYHALLEEARRSEMWIEKQ